MPYRGLSLLVCSRRGFGRCRRPRAEVTTSAEDGERPELAGVDRQPGMWRPVGGCVLKI